MSFKTIRSAQQAIWPVVRESIERTRASRKLVEANPSAHSPAAQARARIPWNHVVSNEAVWAIARADLLNTPEQAAVLTAARAWARSWDMADGPPDEMDAEEDVDLYAAVQALATSSIGNGLNGAAETSGL